MRLALAALLCLLGGCYVTEQVAPGVLRDAGDNLGRPRRLRGDGSTVLLEPGTMVRARLTGGSETVEPSPRRRRGLPRLSPASRRTPGATCSVT